MSHEHWKTAPEDHDFPAAATYLSLVVSPEVAERAVALLRDSPTLIFAAKDLLRASRLPLLERDNKHVAGDLKKVGKGARLSPVLLVRGEARSDLPLVVADGYHRICASYWIDENAEIPCRMVVWPS